jgi:hypothetical protein
MRGSLYQLDEAVEQVVGVVRPAAASGWYCTVKAGTSQRPQPLDHVVVQADVADLDRAELGVDRRSRGASTAKPWLWR